CLWEHRRFSQDCVNWALKVRKYKNMDGIWKYGRLLAVIGWMFWGGMATAQAARTYCNPIKIDYGYTPIPNFSEWGRHRATADPVIVNYQGDYYLFSTNQWGYWWSS